MRIINFRGDLTDISAKKNTGCRCGYGILQRRPHRHYLGVKSSDWQSPARWRKGLPLPESSCWMNSPHFSTWTMRNLFSLLLSSLWDRTTTSLPFGYASSPCKVCSLSKRSSLRSCRVATARLTRAGRCSLSEFSVYVTGFTCFFTFPFLFAQLSVVAPLFLRL